MNIGNSLLYKEDFAWMKKLNCPLCQGHFELV